MQFSNLRKQLAKAIQSHDDFPTGLHKVGGFQRKSHFFRFLEMLKKNFIGLTF